MKIKHNDFSFGEDDPKDDSINGKKRKNEVKVKDKGFSLGNQQEEYINHTLTSKGDEAPLSPKKEPARSPRRKPSREPLEPNGSLAVKDNFRNPQNPSQSNMQQQSPDSPGNKQGGRKRLNAPMTPEQKKLKEFHDQIDNIPDSKLDNQANLNEIITNTPINQPYLNRPFDHIPTEGSKHSEILNAKDVKIFNNDNLGYYSNDDRSTPNESFFNGNLDETLKLEQNIPNNDQRDPRNQYNNLRPTSIHQQGIHPVPVRPYPAQQNGEKQYENINNFDIKEQVERNEERSPKRSPKRANPGLSAQFDIGDVEVIITDFDENTKHTNGLEIIKEK